MKLIDIQETRDAGTHPVLALIDTLIEKDNASTKSVEQFSAKHVESAVKVITQEYGKPYISTQWNKILNVSITVWFWHIPKDEHLEELMLTSFGDDSNVYLEIN